MTAMSAPSPPPPAASFSWDAALPVSTSPSHTRLLFSCRGPPPLPLLHHRAHALHPRHTHAEAHPGVRTQPAAARLEQHAAFSSRPQTQGEGRQAGRRRAAQGRSHSGSAWPAARLPYRPSRYTRARAAPR
ncbi:hypothetical protein AAFF_G00289910 [Aldrovandia affinis]|uniref:Uncharacterized protein n=1 Tax=Aldrovandia affinis TaxID=143900 RepID=A0AAD7R9L4_9TELE|nr:hypothetical protein AAFF_G00289910 [Aldrovandia affinis]